MSRSLQSRSRLSAEHMIEAEAKIIMSPPGRSAYPIHAQEPRMRAQIESKRRECVEPLCRAAHSCGNDANELHDIATSPNKKRACMTHSSGCYNYCLQFQHTFEEMLEYQRASINQFQDSDSLSLEYGGDGLWKRASLSRSVSSK